MREQELGFRESKEADEKEPKHSAPDTSPMSTDKPQEELLPPAEQELGSMSEAVEVPIAFENLSQLIGKNILFRDPEVTGAIDDPPYKYGTIERRNDEFVIVIKRGRYYPYYTGYDRSNIFTLLSQADVDRLRIELEK